MATTKTKTITQHSASRRRPRRRRSARPSAKPRANIIPTSIPATRSAEEKFKEISEANDILSDEKKRKIYDQLGFYSDQIDPAQAEAYARQQQSGGRPPVDFGGFDFSGFSGGPGPAPQAGAGSSTWGSFKDIFSGIFSGAA